MTSTSCNNKNSFTFVWKIENFSLCVLRKNQSLRGLTFTAESLYNTQWFLELYPKGSQGAHDGYTSCFLQRAHDAQRVEIELHFKFEVIGARSLMSFSSSRPRDFKEGGPWGWCNFTKINFFKDNPNQYLPDDILTIECSMVESLPTRIPLNFCLARSEVSVDRFSFKWHIENSSISDHKKVFSTGNSKIEVAFGLQEDDVKITITRNNGSNSSCNFMRTKITLLDAKGFQNEALQSEHFFDEDETWEFPDFLKKSKLLASKEILKDDILTLRCEFSISNGDVFSEIEEYNCEDSPAPLENPVSFESLKMDLRNMFSSGILADVKLKSGDETHQSHKCLLSARSPVFCAMFSHDMEENHSGMVDIPDLDSGTLKLMLSFIYTGCLEEKDYESVSKLMIAADKYQVVSLKEECATFLRTVLSESNVCEVLLLADMVRHDVLKTSAVDFVKSKCRTILRSSQWKQFIENNVRVATEILCKLSIGVPD